MIWRNNVTWFETVLWIIIILGVFCLFSIWHASTHFHKVFYRLSSDKISKPGKFVLLADLHDKEYGKGNAKLLKAIAEECPDAVLVHSNFHKGNDHVPHSARRG